MSRAVDDEAPRHPIKIVARRTGLSQDLIRVWERRYDAIHPRRSSTNRRLYSDQDVSRLQSLARAVAGGRRIGEVARMPTPELERLVAADRAAEAELRPAASVPGPPGADHDHFAACVEAVRALDAPGLEQALSRAAVDLTTPRLVEELLLPLLRHVGDAWREGRLRVGHEHLTTAVLRTFLGGLASRADTERAMPEVVVATPAGQLHELGALIAALYAALDGWRVTYLGPDLPAEDIAAAAASRGARAVVLSIVYPADPRAVEEELRRLRRVLDRRVALLAGGAGAMLCADALREIGAIPLEAFETFRAELARAR